MSRTGTPSWPSAIATTSATSSTSRAAFPTTRSAIFRTDTTGLLNALDAARTWGVRRFAVASSLGVYAGRTEIPWHEELALPTAALPHVIVAFKKAAEPLTTHGLQGSGVQPVVLRIGTIWGPLVDPESPFFYIPPYISAVLRGEDAAAAVRRRRR